MKYVLIARNGQIINWGLTREEAEKLQSKYEAMYPEEKGNMKIEEQNW